MCPICFGDLSVRDSKRRQVIESDGSRNHFSLRRLKCNDCGKLHTELPSFMVPHKHYASEVIEAELDGSRNDSKGNLIIDEVQAENVRLIFSLYLAGLSLLGIIRELEKRNIKSPKGKETWSKRSISTMLINEKYTGSVILLKDKDSTPSYEFKEHHEAIISDEIFEKVQLKMQRRSNVENGKRKSNKYSSKKTRQE